MSLSENKKSPAYKLTPYQFTVALMPLAFLTPSIMQIPTYMLTDHPIDWALMEKAFNIEIERNDCMRLRFRFPLLFGKTQYFIPEYHVSDIPIDDFRGKTREEMEKALSEDSHKTVHFVCGKTFRVRFFHACDGRCGVYLNVAHLAMDLNAVLIFYRDLFCVYDALENGREMPKPLDKFEESIKRELALAKNKAKDARERKYYEDYYSARPPCFFAGVDGMRLLNKTRRRKRDPHFRLVNLISLLFNKTKTFCCSVPEETKQKWKDFARSQNVSFTCLLYLAQRTHLSRINERTEDVLMEFAINRRTKLADQNCGGSRAQSLHYRTIIPESETFASALQTVKQELLSLMLHMDYSILKVIIHTAKYNRHWILYGAETMLLTCMEDDFFKMPLDWKTELRGIGSGHFPIFCYILALANQTTGGMDFYYEYQTHNVNKEDVIAMHEDTMKILDLGIENPDMTIGEIMDAL